MTLADLHDMSCRVPFRSQSVTQILAVITFSYQAQHTGINFPMHEK